MTFDSEFLLAFSNIKIKYTELYSAFLLQHYHVACCCMGVHLGRSH